MSEKNQVKSVAFSALIFGLALAFIFLWGPGSSGCGGKIGTEGAAPTSIATVDQKEVSIRTFYRQLSYDLSMYRAQGISDEMIKQFGLHKRTLESVINNEVLMQAAEERNLQVSDADLRAAIVKIQRFHDKDGNFDPKLYKEASAEEGLTAVEFEAQVRRELGAQKLLAMVQAGAFASDEEIDAHFARTRNTAQVSFVKFPWAQYASKIPPLSASEVAAFSAQQAQAIADHYNNNKLAYFQPEQVKVRQILLRSSKADPAEKRAEVRAKLEGVKKELGAGKDFAELAKAVSEDTESKEQGGDLGFVERGMLPAPVADAAFKLADNSVSEVIESPLGFHLLRAEGKKAPLTKPLESVSAEIAKLLLQQQKAKAFALQDAKKAMSQLRPGKTLAQLFPKVDAAKTQAAGPTQPEAIQTSLFDLGSSAVPQLDGSKALIAPIFKASKPGVLEGNPFELSDSLALVVVDERKVPNPQELEQDRAKIRSEIANLKLAEARESFVKALRQAKAVTTDQQALDSVL